MTDLAHRQATELGDTAPQRGQITVGRPDVVELWGRFVCGKACYIGPGAKEPRGNYARITVDPVTRGVDGFELRTVATRRHEKLALFAATGGTVAIGYARNVGTRGRTATLAGTVYGTLRELRTGKFVRVTGRWVCRIEPAANGVP